MTRKQLAEAIYDMTKANGGIIYSSKQSWVKNVLNGVGALKAVKKSELEDWYNRLAAELN